MRGDSLRDFYAKTLAVLGLGVLAAAGAAVDYWPVGEELPDVTAVSGLTAPAPTLVQYLDQQIPAPAVPVRRAAPPPVAVTALRFVGVPGAGDAVVLDPVPAPVDFLQVTDDLPQPLLVEARALAPVQLEAITADETRGRFSDAMRRTRESFAAARLFLNDAFTGFVGAFRRVSPFWAIGTTGPTSY